MNPQDTEISSLTGLYDHPGYRTLVDQYRRNLQMVEDHMQTTTEPAKFLELGRIWQALRLFTNLLEKSPQQAAQIMVEQTIARFEAAEKQMPLGFEQ